MNLTTPDSSRIRDVMNVILHKLSNGRLNRLNIITKSFLFSHCFDLLIAGSENLAIFLQAAVCILGSKRERFQREMAMKSSSVWFADSNEFCNKPDIDQR